MSGVEAPVTEAAPAAAVDRTDRQFYQPGVIHALLTFPHRFARLDCVPMHLVVHSQQGKQDLSEEQECASKRGLNGLGYHYWLSPTGRIYEVRPVFAKGAHSISHNGWWGVCLQGDCRKNRPTAEQYAALAKLAQYLSTGTLKFLLHLHCELDDTDCPGQMFEKDKVPLQQPCYWASTKGV
jgi:N-acetylmuramoyl-L-alanine amidase